MITQYEWITVITDTDTASVHYYTQYSIIYVNI